MKKQAGLFDVDERLKRLSDIGDQLEAFSAVVDFEMFRPELEAALRYGDGSRGGRPPFDPVMMFKILVIQAQNDLADDRAEFLINDRLSFMRFLGLGLTDKVPDAKTIWAFRERLTRAGTVEGLFARFDRAIREAGYLPMAGQIVDASLVTAPKQRNTEAEKKDVEEGRIPDDWKAHPAKLRQKDRDARWTLVFGKARLREDGTRHPARRHRDPGLRLQVPRQHRPEARLHPEMGRHRRQPARRANAAPGAARQDQHRHHRLGRQRLSLQGKRSLHEPPRLPQPGPSSQAAGTTDAAPHPPRQRQPLERARCDRARLRPAEGADGALHPHHRHRAGQGKDRARQPHLQHPPPGLP
jgi:transposase